MKGEWPTQHALGKIALAGSGQTLLAGGVGVGGGALTVWPKVGGGTNGKLALRFGALGLAVAKGMVGTWPERHGGGSGKAWPDLAQCEGSLAPAGQVAN